mmetsp:Transcript_22285/g.48416  ORF Transcript_22285/g.48416 Transcript_22285/m.48416 type:complete len:235 (-) Transcript_22285:1211-1915(-)
MLPKESDAVCRLYTRTSRRCRTTKESNGCLQEPSTRPPCSFHDRSAWRRALRHIGSYKFHAGLRRRFKFHASLQRLYNDLHIGSYKFHPGLQIPSTSTSKSEEEHKLVVVASGERRVCGEGVTMRCRSPGRHTHTHTHTEGMEAIDAAEDAARFEMAAGGNDDDECGRSENAHDTASRRVALYGNEKEQEPRALEICARPSLTKLPATKCDAKRSQIKPPMGLDLMLLPTTTNY